MARRYTLTRFANDIARNAARAQREQLKQERTEQMAQMRYQAQSVKEAKQRYLLARLQEAEDNKKQTEKDLFELAGILEHTLSKNYQFSFDELRNKETFREFVLPPELAKEEIPVKSDDFLAKISKPSFTEKLIPGWDGRYKRKVVVAEAHFKEYQIQFETRLAQRTVKVNELQGTYNKEKAEFDEKILQQNREVDEFENGYKNGNPTEICSYCTLVLEHSDYPEGFPKEFRIAYVPEPKELIIEYELPTKAIIPSMAEYRYIKTRDVIEEKPRKVSEIKSIYEDVVAAVCLRTIYELIEADAGNHMQVIVFNGFVQAVDPATGKDIRPCLISIRVTKERFLEINLSKVDKKTCLRNLGAQVSSQPDALVAVKPVVEFNMVDKRFVEESDILADLESRPNLMELNPFEFENFVNNLFSKIGFEAKLTRSIRDGGVDVVAFDPRPILGGKVVIQAKRYKNVVGVSAVRDLYGTMINEGASKGILVTTSHYGPDASNFAKDKPIEMIDGGGLLYLLEQQGIKAKIIFPED
jgi:restriction system protein